MENTKYYTVVIDRALKTLEVVENNECNAVVYDELVDYWISTVKTQSKAFFCFISVF